MPLLRGAVTFARFQAEHTRPQAKDTRRSFSGSIRRRVFEPIDKASDEDRAAGWVQIDDPDATELAPQSFLIGEYVLLSYRVDKLRVPAPLVKAELEAYKKEFEAKNDRPMKRAELREQKEAIHHKLRTRAFPISRVYDVSWNLTSDRLAIWCSARSLIDEITAAVEETFGLRLHALSPGGLSVQVDASRIRPTAALFGTVAGEVRAS